VLELNIQLDHVRLVVSIPPKYAVSNFMGDLKGKLAIRLFNRYEKLGRRSDALYAAQLRQLLRNCSDKRGSVNRTARALTENGLTFIAARNLHHQ
jgi:REP element-mobilizing transposase RayT